MYFPSLENIEDLIGTDSDQIDLVNQFDHWLATRRVSTRNYLSPSTFSRHTGMDLDLAFELFIIATHNTVKLLKPRFDIFISDKDIRVDSVYSKDEIPKTYIDPTFGTEHLINLETDVRVYFELLEEPVKKPTLFPTDSGKSLGVGYSEFIIKQNAVTLSRFFDD